ncbi:hypothetical protein [Caulobacter sp.]|uniref:hypothetical protein n=1 Tax=Caulobacter sp. TaxID=78 RepID=UPI003BAF5812
MAIVLPAAPIQSKFNPRMVSAGGVLRSPIGGAAINVSRPGDRHAIDVTIPPLPVEQARQWRSRLVRSAATGESLRLQWPQDGVPALGTIFVDGANQTGMILTITGGTVGAVVPEGAYFSVSDGSRYDLYPVAEDRLLSGGDALLDLGIMLRRPPLNGGVLDFTPIIEGLGPKVVSWSLEHMIDRGFSFTIEENR